MTTTLVWLSSTSQHFLSFFKDYPKGINVVVNEKMTLLEIGDKKWSPISAIKGKIKLANTDLE